MMLGPGGFAHSGQPTWQVKRQGRKRSMVLVDVRLLYLLGGVAACSLLYAGFVSVAFMRRGGSTGGAAPTADQLWRQKSVAPADWNTDDVEVWASGIGLDGLAAGLRRNGVDGQLLLALTEKDIRDDVGVENELQIRKIEKELDKLRRGDTMPPSALGQGLLMQGLNSSAPAGALASAGAPKTLRSRPSSVGIRKFSLFRIWQQMSADAPFMTLEIDPALGKIWNNHIEHIQAEVIGREGAQAGASPARGKEGKADKPFISLVHRNGVSILSEQDLPADTDKLFLLVGQELFFFPDDVVGEKLSVPLPSAQRSVEVEVVSRTPRLVHIKNFLSPSECEEIMALAKPKLEPSTVLEQGDQTKGENKVRDSVRTSDTAWLMNKNEPIVAKVRQRVAELVHLPMTFAEDMQVLRYDYKQHYHVHYDFFDPAMYPGDKRWMSGHNRLATVFFYLTSVEEGGETVFPYANAPVAEHEKIHAYGPCEDAVAGSLKVPARQGHAIVFYNMKPDGHLEGKLDKTALHGGCDPIKGQKWAANYWIRNGPVL